MFIEAVCPVCDYPVHYCACGREASKPVGTSKSPVQALHLFYAVCNDKGQFYRTRANNRAAGWEDNLENAKPWVRRAIAHSKVTALANQHPSQPAPELLEFVVTAVNIIDQTERVFAARQKKRAEDASRDDAITRFDIEETQREIIAAQARLARLQGKGR
jgi:hypothetical protein